MINNFTNLMLWLAIIIGFVSCDRAVKTKYADTDSFSTIKKDTLPKKMMEVLQPNELLFSKFDMELLKGINKKEVLDSLPCFGIVKDGNIIQRNTYANGHLIKSIIFDKKESNILVTDNTPKFLDTCKCLKPIEKMYWSNGKLYTIQYFNSVDKKGKFRLVSINISGNNVEKNETISPNYYFNVITVNKMLELLEQIKY